MKKNTLFTIVILSVVVPLIIIFSVSQGLASGNPVEYSSWQSGDVSSECAKVGGLPEGVKVSSISSGVNASSSNNTITIKNVNVEEDEPKSFSWSSTNGVGAVIVVANSGANVWHYNPQKSSGSGLYGYDNGSIDHITFCWSPPPDPTNTLVVLPSSTATEILPDVTDTPTSEFTHTETSIPQHTPTSEISFTPTPTVETTISETLTQTSTKEVEDEETPIPTETEIPGEETITPTPTETMIETEETITPTPTETMIETEETITPTPTQTATEIEETDTPEPTPTLTFTPEITASPTPEFTPTPTPTAIEPQPEPAVQLSMEIASINGDPDVKLYLQAGDQVTYSVVVINTGNVDLMNVDVSDPLQIIAGDPIDRLAAGISDETNFSASYIITQDDVDRGSFTNIFTVIGTPSKGDLVKDEATITVEGTGENPSIELVKEVATINGNPSAKYFKKPGDKITYRFIVTNTGNVTLINITVIDPLATVSEGVIEFLAPGESDSVTFSATYIITEEDYYARLFTNIASVSGSSWSGTLVTGEAVVTVEREERQLY